MKKHPYLSDTLKMLGVMIASTLLAALFKVFAFQEATIVIIFMLAVLVVTQITSHYLYGILSSFLSVLIFNFFFTEPIFTFNTHQPDYIFTFFILFGASMISSTITSRLKLANQTAEMRYQQVELLGKINQTFSLNPSDTAIAESLALLATYFQCPVSLHLKDGPLERDFHSDAMERSQSAKGASFELKSETGDLGAMTFGAKLVLSAEETQFCRTVTSLMTQNIERQSLLRRQVETDYEMREQKLKNSLLSAISHDLRTPLATIIGSIETLSENEAVLKK